MSDPAAPFVEVAVPLPLASALTYAVPAELAGRVEIGMRVRVGVGRRRLLGVVVGHRDAAPEGVNVRPIDRLVDERPALPAGLMEIARFTSDYYLAPLGEVLQAMLPSGLEPWGDRRIWLTDAGALSLPRDAAEEAVVACLREAGRLPVGDLVRRAGGGAATHEAIRRLEADGRVAIAQRERRGARYAPAVELARGDVADLLERCGRSRPAREVVEYLAALGRPATSREVTSVVGCGAGVVRRLVRLGVLRQFTQVERLAMDHQRLGGPEPPPFELRPDQGAALEALLAAVDARRYAAYLLAGMAGAGKTEVYLRCAQRVLADGGGVVLLVPEIALVPALARTLEQRFGDRAAILHSALSGGERRQEWERIRSGEARLVLGPRSAVFAPVRDLRLLVVDEEQDGAYKQETSPRYHGRDVAMLRARQEGAVAVLVSATPSLETRHNVARGKVERLGLTERVGHGRLPEGVLVDLRQEEGAPRPGDVRFSKALLGEIERTLAAGDQAILLRNRRGYAPILLCRACGEDMRCDDCGLPRTYHKRAGQLLCHYCGSRRAAPQRCPACAEPALDAIGAGTERVEEQFGELFPGVAVETLDRDAVRRRGSVAAVLERFRRGETRVLIGTQMVSKGHHFPSVALTAVLHADTYLSFPDFRAVERTYNLLVQVAGRAGRGERPGKVVVQTYHPDHYAVRAALEHDDDAFAEEELRFRRIFHYPPFTRMVQLVVRDSDRRRGEREIGRLADALTAVEAPPGVRVMGPAPAPFERLRGRWRFQLLLRGPSGRALRAQVRAALARVSPADLVVDVDPFELL